MAKENLKEQKISGTTEKPDAVNLKNVSAEIPDHRKKSVYSMQELAANAERIFHTRKECVEAALNAAGISSCTACEAGKIVEEFLKREVG